MGDRQGTTSYLIIYSMEYSFVVIIVRLLLQSQNKGSFLKKKYGFCYVLLKILHCREWESIISRNVHI